MRDAMAQLSDQQDDLKNNDDSGVQLSNLRCLISPDVDDSCSPPPCPPPSSSSSSSTSSSPRPPESPPPPPTEVSSLVQIIAECVDEEETSTNSDVDSDVSVIIRENTCWGNDLSPRAPLAVEEISDSEESARAQTRLQVVDECCVVELVPHGSIISNLVVANLCSGKVSSNTTTKMRQKPTSSAGSSTPASSDQTELTDHHHQNNNSECPLQCNGMVSAECCWNGDCMEAISRKTSNNLKPAIRLKSSVQENNSAGKNSRRVTFNETLNKFFDADYVILVGEDCNGDETTRLVSMCKKSNCQPEGNFDLNFPELCPFEPPLEYIDQVTLSPPEGYKDVLGATRQDDESESESSGEARSEDEDGGQSPVCEQCSSCSACASQQQQRYVVETITLTTVTERRIVREANEADEPRLSGILKGGKLWKNGENDSLTSDQQEGETASRRSVRFCEDELDAKCHEDQDQLLLEGGDHCSDTINIKEDNLKNEPDIISNKCIAIDHQESSLTQNTAVENIPPAELTLTFRLGNSVLLSDKLPANSAVRQLFPDSEAQQRLLGVVTSPEGGGDLKDVSESDVPSLPSPGQTGPAGSSSDDEAAARTSTQIRRTIERNALRRSLLRCSEPLRRKPPPRTEDNSLVERIRQLTCDVDNDAEHDESSVVNRSSPPSQPSTYKKLTELFSRRERCHSESLPSTRSEPLSLPADNSCCWLMVDPVRPPNDFARLGQQSLQPHTISPTTSLPPPGNFIGPKPTMSRVNASEARKQFLSNLGERETPPDGSASNVVGGDRGSIAETTYTLEDIDEALAGECACPPVPMNQLISNQPPDVVATAQENQQRNGGEPVDELALFVQRDMGRIERLKKRYSLTDDDQDDYGFSRRPSVRGIKPRFGSTTEILQQIQLQLQPPALACPSRAGSHLTWPYAAEPNTSSSPVSSPSDPQQPRRRQPGVPAPRGANGLPVLPEDTYYTTQPVQDYRYLEYSAQNGSGYVYASTGNLYTRNEMVPYNPARQQQQQLSNCDSPPPPLVVRGAPPPGPPPYAPHPQYQTQQMYGTVARRTTAPAPVHYANGGTLPHPGYVARNNGRTYAAAPQQQRSDSPQRLYQRPPNFYPQQNNNTAPTGRYNYPPKNNFQQELPSPSQRTLSPVPAAGSPTRASSSKFERGAPEGASASPGFAQDSYAQQTPNPTSGAGTQAGTNPSSVYYAMNV